VPIFGRPGREGLWLGAKMRRMDRENDNPHDEHLRFGWMTVRYGIKHVSEDGEKLGRVLDWIEETKSSVPDPRFLKAWEAILAGDDPVSLDEIVMTANFFDLPPERLGWWRQLVQSQPFTVIVPGRSVRVRRAAVSPPVHFEQHPFDRQGLAGDPAGEELPSFKRQIARHEASKFDPDVRSAMATFQAILEETARWDVVRGIDPLERWRRDKEAKAQRAPV